MNADPIEALQDRLERELSDATRTEQREIAARIRSEGHRLVFLLNGLVRASRLYALENDALRPPSEELAEVLAGLLERLGAVEVVLVAKLAYVNDVRLRVRPLEQAAIDQLAGELDRHAVGGISFHRQLDADGFRRLALALASPTEGPCPAAALRARVAPLRDVEVSDRWRFRTTGDEGASQPLNHSETLASAAREARDALVRLDAGWMPNPVRLRRVAIEIVESLRARPARAALAPLCGPSEGGERHAVSVCQLSLMLGEALGLRETALGDLGVAALLHDVGYLAVRHPVRHALAGVRWLLRQRGPGDTRVGRLLAVLEHTDDYRRADAAAGVPTLFARILHITEHYDLLVAAAPGRLRLSPATALSRMWAGRGERYDPALLALFAQQLGCQPPGTVLELSDGCWGLVVRPGGSRERWAHPVVRIVREADGDAVHDGAELDLYDRRDGVRACRVIEPALVEPRVAEACRTALADAA